MKLRSISYLVLPLSFTALGCIEATSQREIVFTKIYDDQGFGTAPDGYGSSGGGSALETTVAYREFLQNFFSAYDIHTVVDLGCGNWEFSCAINWEGIEYLGIDVVPKVIANNQQRYGAANIQFLQADGVSTDLPYADLLICKDVLQHLPNEDIATLIGQFHKFKFCLITNGVGGNEDIPVGGGRGVDLTLPPFSLNGDKVLLYETPQNNKQVLLLSQDLED